MARSDHTPAMRNEPVGQTCDGVVHGSKGISSESTLFPEGVPKEAAVSAVQEVYIGLANGDVSRSGICVQLLMPLLQELVLNSLCHVSPLRRGRPTGFSHHCAGSLYTFCK